MRMTKPSPRILLTGATGYLGSQLALALAEAHVDVHVLCRAHSNLSLFEATTITTHIISNTFESIDAAVAAAAPDIVIHLASLFIAEHQSSQVHELIQSNIEFPSLLLEAMQKNKVKHFINTATSWQYFEPNQASYHPTNLYAATKQAFQDVLEYYVTAHQFSAVSLVIFDTYGSNDPRKKLFHLFLSTLKSQTPIQMSAGEQKIDLVYIDDVVSAYQQAIIEVQQLNATHRSFSVKSGQAYSLKQIASMVEQLAQKPLPIEWGARGYRAREVFTPWQADEKLPHWSAQVPLEQGIALLLKSSGQL